MAKAPSYKMKTRMMIVLVAMIVLGFCVVLHQLFQVQVVKGAEYQGYALEQQLRTKRIGAKRGAIYDAKGELLVESADVWSVCIAPGNIDSDEKRNAVSDVLVKHLGVDPAFVAKKLARKNSLYEVVKTKVEQTQADTLMAEVRANGLAGVISLEQDTRRYYRYGNFAANVLGFTNNDNVGAYGLESYYDKTLSGTAGRVQSLRNSKGVEMSSQYEKSYDAQDGNSLMLTLDATIQHYLEKNMETAVAEHKVGKRAVGIVMDVKTGAILGLTNKPDFDPNDPYTIFDPKVQEELDQLAATEPTEEQKEVIRKARENAQYDQWRNKAISDPYEPGSVFKIVTMSGALDSRTITLEAPGYYCPGYIMVAGKPIHCWIYNSARKSHDQQTLQDAVKNSCNPAFITIGQMMGSNLFSDYFSNFGLTEGTGVDLPGEANSIYHPKSIMTLSDLSSSAFGQTFKVTAMQLITACSAAVNGGQLMQPYIVKQILDPEGNVVRAVEPFVKRQVVSAETSAQVCSLLEQVVGGGGSGKAAKVPGYRIGGKTGTSEKIEMLPDGTRNDKTILSFFGFAPVDDPQIACLVMLDEPGINGGFGSTIAAPIVGSILADVLPYVGIEPQFTEEELANVATSTPAFEGKDIHEAESIARIAGLKFRVIGKGTTVIKQVPAYQVPIPKDTTVVLYTEEEVAATTVTVPDVVGMTAEQVNRVLVNDAGLNLSISGMGVEGSHSIANSQNPAAGTEVAPGTIVTVEFIDSTLAG